VGLRARLDAVTKRKIPALAGNLTRVYPKFSGLAAWSEDCKWYSPLPLGAVISLFCESA